MVEKISPQAGLEPGTSRSVGQSIDGLQILIY